VPAGNVAFSLAGFVVFYSVLAVVELFLMVRTVRRGPEDLIELPELLGAAASTPAE
jgi:cytochrome d ubiquinol oxidase subunit I